MNFTDDRLASRRNVVRAAAVLPLLGLGVDEARGFVRSDDQKTIAGAVDANFDQTKELQIVRDPDPSDETPQRGQVLHATSDGTATGDYALSLAATDDEELALSDVADSEEGFAYDWFEGEAETGMAPDEAWLVLRTAEMSEREFRAVFRTEFSASRSGEWETRSVGPEVDGTFPEEGSGQRWKEYRFDAMSSVRVTENLLETFGGDATVLAAGIGRGTPQTEPTVADTYYDNIVLDGEKRTLEATVDRSGGNE